MENKALQLTANPLRSLAAAELSRSGGAARRQGKSMERPTHNNRARLVSPRYASDRSSRQYV